MKLIASTSAYTERITVTATSPDSAGHFGHCNKQMPSAPFSFSSASVLI